VAIQTLNISIRVLLTDQKYKEEKMNINYRILSKDDEDHSLIIRYWTDIISEESLATSLNTEGNINVDDNGHPLRCRTDYNLTLYGLNSPTNTDLHSFAIRCAPIEFLRLLELKKTNPQALNLSEVNNIIGIDMTFEISDTQIDNKRLNS
jgi:hypothetical protein